MLIIFDLDGTLVQSNILYSEIKKELKDLLKGIISKELYEEFVSIPRSILEILSYISKNDSSCFYSKKAWEIVENYEIKGYENATIHDDVLPTLKILKEKGATIAILTNNSRKLTDFAMKQFNLNKYVDFVVTRDDVERVKPDPEGIYKIMKKFNRSKEETLFIGDSWLDAESAFNAGVKFAYFGKDSGETREKKIPAKIEINSISEVLNLGF
ncbi:MAG: HAD family hydrolase [Candidatus Heimdallarchaeum endolithica]|uniref:HAD family hydrolase n=1 Tax=Candidatus Heimdallarchaeum endolithica TaxID=2876572 RepID=A0A9Y1FP32_9ARCH|nr:MAG: HAD family hydrolase [Candidatus Heimdallarchaeum endolithica]